MKPSNWDEDFFLAGWLRWLPAPAFMLCVAADDMHRSATTGRLDAQPEPSVASCVLRTVGGMEGPVDLIEWAEVVEGGEDRLDRLANAAGVTMVTNADLLDLLVILGIIRRSSDPDPEWMVVAPLPLPEDVVALTPAERDEEDHLRWCALFLEEAQVLMRELLACGQRATSLSDLARTTGLDPESVRQALEILEGTDTLAVVGELECTAVNDPIRVETARAYPE